MEDRLMKKGLLSKITVFVLSFGVVLLAATLPAPTNLQVPVTDNVINASWDAVDGALKYSVCIVAEYDLDADGEADMSEDFDFGTSDRTDGLPIDTPSLDIPLDALNLDLDGDGTAETIPVAARARVKALNPGHGRGNQNNPFSEFVDIVLP
jgi:hypothetical protein